MARNAMMIVALSAALMTAPGFHVASAQQMTNNCAPEDKIDSSILAQAKQKLMAVGYTQVHDLRKGCDNFWHAQAMKDGAAVRVALSPAGKALPEGD
jgi:hypothetical protein